jgi:hypothetical protein
LHATPELAAAAAEYVELHAATLAEPHDDQSTIRTSLRVILHLRRSIQRPFVRRLTPALPAVLRRVLDIFVSARIRMRLVIQPLAHFSNCFDEVPGVRRRGASGEEVVVWLALGGFEMCVLLAV